LTKEEFWMLALFMYNSGCFDNGGAGVAVVMVSLRMSCSDSGATIANRFGNAGGTSMSAGCGWDGADQVAFGFNSIISAVWFGGTGQVVVFEALGGTRIVASTDAVVVKALGQSCHVSVGSGRAMPTSPLEKSATRLFFRRGCISPDDSAPGAWPDVAIVAVLMLGDVVFVTERESWECIKTGEYSGQNGILFTRPARGVR
jgi:hypothetical protein